MYGILFRTELQKMAWDNGLTGGGKPTDMLTAMQGASQMGMLAGPRRAISYNQQSGPKTSDFDTEFRMDPDETQAQRMTRLMRQNYAQTGRTHQQVPLTRGVPAVTNQQFASVDQGMRLPSPKLKVPTPPALNLQSPQASVRLPSPGTGSGGARYANRRMAPVD